MFERSIFRGSKFIVSLAICLTNSNKITQKKAVEMCGCSQTSILNLRKLLGLQKNQKYYKRKPRKETPETPEMMFEQKIRANMKRLKQEKQEKQENDNMELVKAKKRLNDMFKYNNW